MTQPQICLGLLECQAAVRARRVSVHWCGKVFRMMLNDKAKYTTVCKEGMTMCVSICMKRHGKISTRLMQRIRCKGDGKGVSHVFKDRLDI